MQRKYKQIVCYILIIFMIVSGMCVKNVKADSVLSCATEHQNNANIDSQDVAICDGEICTTEMLGVRCASHIHNESVSLSKTYEKISFVCISSDVFSKCFTKFYMAVNIVQPTEVYSKTAVLHFIHNKDGKKQNLTK